MLALGVLGVLGTAATVAAVMVPVSKPADEVFQRLAPGSGDGWSQE